MGLIRYLRERRRTLIAFGAVCGVFAVSFALYHLPLAAVGYPAGLCLLAGLIWAVWDSRRLRRRHEQLLQLAGMGADMEHNLPEPRTLQEEDAQLLIRALCREQRETVSRMNARYADMMDYYTVWAHQIKTPIAAMALQLNQEDSALGRRLKAELMRVEQYVAMVLAYLRLDSESTDYVIREYDLDGIVRQAVKRFAGEFIARKLTLTYAPLNARVITDEKWLLFVVEQVISNALKYTQEGGVAITLEEPKTLCIRDTGIGIAPEDLPRVFDKGYTGCNGRADKKASGIGLYLCRQICRRLGHGISAQSRPGEGTVIRIDLASRQLERE
ncbi:MAG: sensor histidine kinase [Aristaeellaceae bacterium]